MCIRDSLNWALVDNGAWDFAADARGYSWGAALDYTDGDWALRAGRFLLPAASNGLALDKRIFKHYGDHRDLHRVDRRERQMCIRDRSLPVQVISNQIRM